MEVDVDAVLDLDFSDPGVLSKAIGTMSSSFGTDSNQCLIITDENTDSIVDIESLDEVSDLVQDYMPTEQDALVVEEIVESDGLGERSVQFFVTNGLQGGGEEIVTEIVSPPKFDQQEFLVTDDLSNAACPFLLNDASQADVSTSTSASVDIASNVFVNDVEEVSLSGSSVLAANVNIPVVNKDISQTIAGEELSSNSTQLLVDDGIIADDMNSLFEQFESQGDGGQKNPVPTAKSNKTLSIVYKGLDNSVCTSENTCLQKNAHKSSKMLTSKQFTISATPKASTYITSHVVVPKTKSNVHASSTKPPPQMVSLLNTRGTTLASPSVQKNVNICLQTLVNIPMQNSPKALSDSHLLPQPKNMHPQVDSQLTPETTTANTENRLADVSVSEPAATPDFITASVVAPKEGPDWVNFPSEDIVACELEVVSDQTICETVSPEHLPEVRAEVEVECETEVVEEVVGQGIPCASDPLGLLGNVMSEDGKHSSMHFCQNKTSGREYSPSPGSDTLCKIPGYMSTLTQGGSSLPLDDTSQVAVSSLLNNSASSALLDRDPSPEREAPHSVSVYNRIPDYCSNFASSQQYSKSADSPSCKRSRRKRTKHRHKHHHSHKHSRHYRRSHKRVRAKRDSSSSFYDCSSDDDVIGISRPNYHSSSSSFSSSYSSSSEESTTASSDSEGSRSRSRSPLRCKHMSSRSHRRNKSTTARKGRRCHYKKGRGRGKRRSRCSRSRSSSVSYHRSRSRSSDTSWKRRHRRSRRSSADSSDRKPEKDAKKEAHELAMAQRRVVYVGGISDSHTPSDLRKRFATFGEIETTSVHFRLRGDNYGFVTYKSSKDAQTAITNGNKVGGPHYNLCFGGRRMFCKTDYADLDGCTAVKEEWALHERTREEPADDFDALLQQTLKKLK